MCRLCENSGTLNLLESAGPIQACTGIALPFSFTVNCSCGEELHLEPKSLWNPEVHNGIKTPCIISRNKVTVKSKKKSFSQLSSTNLNLSI